MSKRNPQREKIIAEHGPGQLDVSDIQLSKKALKTLKTKQVAFVIAMLRGDGITETAESLGIGRTTAHAWLNNETIKNEIERLTLKLAQKQLENAILTRVEGSGILSDIARDESNEARDRINSIKTLGSFHGWEAPKQHQHAVTAGIFEFMAKIEGGGIEDFQNVPKANDECKTSLCESGNDF